MVTSSIPGVTVPTVLKCLTALPQLRSVVLPYASLPGQQTNSRAERAQVAGIAVFNSSMEGTAELLQTEHDIAARVREFVDMGAMRGTFEEMAPPAKDHSTQEQVNEDTKTLKGEVERACWTAVTEMPDTSKVQEWMNVIPLDGVALEVLGLANFLFEEMFD